MALPDGCQSFGPRREQRRVSPVENLERLASKTSFGEMMSRDWFSWQSAYVGHCRWGDSAFRSLICPDDDHSQALLPPGDHGGV